MNHIRIGSSTNSSIKVELSEEYTDIMKILTHPFGSNRMRYQYPEVFSYTLDGNQLTVTKNSKNIAATCTPLFTPDGWNLDLQCSLIPYPKVWNTSKDILIGEYGEVVINEPIHTHYRYGILIPTFGRYEYTKESLESLRDSELPKGGTLVIIVDESLTKDVDDDKRKTNRYIRDFQIEGISMIQIHKHKHGNMFDSLRVGLDLIYSRCDYLMNLDSDTIHKKGWIEDVMEADRKVRIDFPEQLVIVTGYDSNQHKTIQKQEYGIKESLGGCHMTFRSRDYVDYLRYTLISHKWDTNIYTQVSRLGGKLICTISSVIQHIGCQSSVREGKNKDKANDY